jgi:hypothetical protein
MAFLSIISVIRSSASDSVAWFITSEVTASLSVLTVASLFAKAEPDSKSSVVAAIIPFNELFNEPFIRFSFFKTFFVRCLSRPSAQIPKTCFVNAAETYTSRQFFQMK